MATKKVKEEAEVTEVAEVEEVNESKKATKKTTKATAEPEVKEEAPAPKKTVKKTVKKDAEEEPEVEVKAEPTVEAPKEEAPLVKEEAPKPVEDPIEVSVEQKLVALYTLQQVDSKIDEIRAYRGNLPLEIQDIEDEIAGLETRIANFKEESKKHQKDISDYKIKIKETEALIKKYEDQQNNVRNNREYDSLTKEIEYQQLDNQLSEKRIREITAKDNDVATKVAEAQMHLTELRTSLQEKKDELHSLVEGTEKEEEQLLQRSADCEKLVEDRLLVAYKRIRKNARNGLAVVGIFDEACGGCFNRIPPQHQLDICTHKKIIVCEYCGRILVDKGIIAQYNA
jgi:predicted  nucleic acid-binding Zn-ribbon protein